MVPCIARMPSLCGLKHQMSHGPDKRRPRGTCGLKVVCKSEDDGSDQKNRRGTNQSRRLSVLGLWATIPLLNGLGQEARMWRDEMEYYRRKMTNAIDETVVADPTASSKPKPNQKVAKKLDAKFAATLIESMDSAAGDSKEEYRTVCDQLRRREIVEFQKAGTCGHCGSQRGLAAYSDRDYFDFETYIRGKALLQMAPRVSENEADKEEYVRKIQLSMGSSIYRYILRDVDIEGAAAVGIAPGGAVSRDNLLSASPDLDSIRKGVAAILEYFRQKGYMYRAGISQFGISRDEYENHQVWEQGEPAYLKYWLISAADQRATMALQAEEYSNMGFLSATIAAYLRRCGVDVRNAVRIQSLADEDVISDQSTLRRVRPL